MAQYNSVYVDEKYSPVVIDALRTSTFLVPGLTYNPTYATGDSAGAIVNFYSFTEEVVGREAVAQDFSSAEPTNALTPVYIYNAYRQSKKLYQQTADSMTPDYANNVMASISEDVREGRELGALAALRAVAGTNTTAATITTANVKPAIAEGWTKLKTDKADPNLIIMSPSVFDKLAQVQEGKFTPETNEQLVQAGSLGRYYGMSIFISPQLAASANTAISIATTSTTAQTVSLALTDFIIYDRKYFALINNLTAARIIPSETFAGMLAQVEDNVGVRLLNAKCGFSWLHT